MGHIVHLSDVPEHAIPDGRWQPLNLRLGIRNFGVNAVVMDPGDEMDIEHDEADSGHQELYVVVSGRAGFRLGDEEVEAGPGDVVAVPDPSETRDYWALEEGTRIVCIGAGPGAEHEYGEWITKQG
jgi:quercetin dioxygenase-like cupin family protein